ncbi:MAG: diacylglycerol kinase family lipid kinase [Inquilinus limosus]|uniref:Diacylglycerol kinase family lipid kinase n=1 Tax=Inquilinus limosus TaxID=171674 RepID=A0A952FH64_9PROT|nr:diacylglycerol kinase family lipid kinase [Inquilinus limosus]
MRVALVLNGAAGALLGRTAEAIAAPLDRILAAAGAEGRAAVAEGDALSRALDAAVASDAEMILVGGGDGTIIAAAERLLAESRAGGPARPSGTRPLGILPLGTANLLARDLGIPLSPEAALPALLAGIPRRIDVGLVNGRIFLNSSLPGIAPRMVQQRERMRRTPGRLKWLRLARAFFRGFDRGPRLHVVLQADGRPVRLITRTLAISNNPLAEGFAAIHSRAALDGGVLGVYAARIGRRLDLWRLLARLVAGTWQHDRATVALAARRIDVISRRARLWVANDGENHLLATPLRYRILPRALTVLVPRADTDKPM